MAKVKITGHASGTGILTVTAPNTSTDRTITLPDATGTLLNSDGSAASLTAIPAANITGTLPAISGANLTGIAAGLTQSSTWYVTTTYQASATSETITNWAESNAANYDRLGTSPTQSSGIFTLPATGWWMISLNLVCTQSTGTADSWGLAIKTSTNSGGAYGWAGAVGDRFTSDVTNGYKQRTVTMIVKCENASTFRFQGWLQGVDETYFNVRGGTQDASNGATYMNIMKLADV